ncbi:hypothetical protein D3C81_415450 [compost metagenome]
MRQYAEIVLHELRDLRERPAFLADNVDERQREYLPRRVLILRRHDKAHLRWRWRDRVYATQAPVQYLDLAIGRMHESGFLAIGGNTVNAIVESQRIVRHAGARRRGGCNQKRVGNIHAEAVGNQLRESQFQRKIAFGRQLRIAQGALPGQRRRIELRISKTMFGDDRNG